MQGNFCVLANYVKADGGTVEQGLKELIPDIVLRPFLTPTSGISIPQGQTFAVFRHNDIIEFVIRCNLREYFRGKEYDADKYAPVFDEDYEYYAHFALFETEDGKVKVVCSWGGFYDYYASQSRDDRQKFLADLESKKYPRLLHLLTQSEFKFEKINGIGGFSLAIDIDYTDDTEDLGRRINDFFTLHPSLFSQLSSAAVEVWQGARLLVWRKLLQRYVLLHKVPIVDLPSVILHDATLEEAFTMVDGKPDIFRIATVLTDTAKSIEEHLADGELANAVLQLLSTSLVFSTHFAQDGLYNYITDTFNPDRTLTALFNEIVEKISKKGCSQSLLTHLHKGIVELQAQDSWKYFKFPSFLNQLNS